MDRHNTTHMVQLNPTTTPDNENVLSRGVFPPTVSYYNDLFAKESFTTLLATNVLEDKGMTIVAKYYNVEDEWNTYLAKHENDTKANRYFVLLCIVKTKSQRDNLYVSFVEGLHRHAAIILCLTCSCFNLKENTLQKNTLKKKHFQEVPHYKRPNDNPEDVLDQIFNDNFPAKMLTQTFPVQVLFPSNITCEIQPLFNTLVENSKWISTNKRNSAEKQISTRLSEALQKIMTHSNEKDRDNFRPKLIDKFRYQVDCTPEKFQQKLKKEREEWVEFPEMLRDGVYLTYIKDPFNDNTTKAYLEKTSPPSKGQQKMKPTKFPPYGIHWENLTCDVGPIEKGGLRCIDVRHYNAYLIIPQIVYHLSSKLVNEPLHNRLGQDRELQMIRFLTRYGYATRASPYLKIHGAYSKYTDIKQTAYINSCDEWNRIVPVTLFLVTLFNASFMYHENCRENLLIMALDGFDIGKSLSDDTFMNTLSK